MKTWVRNCLFALALCGMIDCLSYGGILSATFEESLDLPFFMNGPRTFLNSNATLGPGFELSESYENPNSYPWVGFLQVDLTGNILTLTPDLNANYQIASVNISSISFSLAGQYISNVQLLEGTLINPNSSFLESITFTDNSISLNWSVADPTISDPNGIPDVFEFEFNGFARYELTLSNANAVPEPSALGIFAFCAVGMALARRSALLGGIKAFSTH